MAAIEKVCELCGDYVGPQMYQYKRDFIQVCPKHKKEFSNQKHTLVIHSRELCYLYSFGGYTNITDQDDIGYYKYVYSGRLAYRYNYELIVPGIKGNVNGHYFESTFNLGKIKRKLKRLLKTRKLNTLYLINKKRAFKTN